MRAKFATTRWSVVLAAAQTDVGRSRAALASLCEAYWYPLYAYVRRRGYDADEACDLTQGFFTWLLEKETLRGLRPQAGRFRSFLLACLKNFLANEWDRARALKRGGARETISLDSLEAERRYHLEPAEPSTPETVYQRRWALTVLDRVLQQLGQEMTAADKGELFAHLRGTLLGCWPRAPYVQVAAQLSMSEGAVKVAVHRLRRRYGELLRGEIAHTVVNPDEVDGEIRHLLSAIG